MCNQDNLGSTIEEKYARIKKKFEENLTIKGFWINATDFCKVLQGYGETDDDTKVVIKRLIDEGFIQVNENHFMINGEFSGCRHYRIYEYNVGSIGTSKTLKFFDPYCALRKVSPEISAELSQYFKEISMMSPTCPVALTGWGCPRFLK